MALETDGDGSAIAIDAAWRFRIFGRAYPERSGWWFDPITIQAVDEDGIAYAVRAEMTGSNFTASLDVRDSLRLEAPDVRVYLEGIVRTVLDTIGLFAGCSVDCEVVQMELPGGEIVVLDSAFGGLELDRTDEEFRAMALTAQFVRGLRLGLADFRLAIRVPHDTVFLAYRALDGIRADIAEREDIEDKGDSWVRMREITRIGREDIDGIKTKADARRHGVAVDVTQEDREIALRLLQAALVGYRDWCVEHLDDVRRLVGPVEPDGDSVSSSDAG